MCGGIPRQRRPASVSFEGFPAHAWLQQPNTTLQSCSASLGGLTDFPGWQTSM